ncbi:helix-hairpin-helix domain-containing protein [uncultured Allomuricauda sp.]|uniref:ComEA family DNA-binding protein n=1 Tax=Flagellimonas sp. W118 TaxID=3410791 RepID=UPI00261A4287|nr:helix-hairpin-helix domain-containing protein [uncultured Allomuricauda sp.]
MNNFKSHFKFNKQERSGIFFLLVLIIILQGVFFYIKTKPFQKETLFIANVVEQSQLDSLRLLALQKDSIKIFPFNPNYISDYKGYSLGMSVDELDRLFAFRKTGSYINSVEEFQKVTQISDSLLAMISTSFKFPEWTKRKKVKTYPTVKSKNAIEAKDLNLATAEELKSIYGIGETLSNRIIKFRDRLGGFLINEQLNDVYGLEPEVVQRTLEKFVVLSPPSIEKININLATAEEISRLIYINRKVANEIVTLRNEKGNIESFEKLFNINGFPINKIDRIKLYLTL